MKIVASHNSKNFMVLRDDLTRAHRRRMAEAIATNDSAAIEAVLRETVLEVELVIGDETVTGLDDVLDAFENRDDITAQVEGFWANAWFNGYLELQHLGKPKLAA